MNIPIRAGTKNKTKEETMSVLQSIREVLPISEQDWKRVEDNHAIHYPTHARDYSSIRRKFQSLYRSRQPTGDPDCPAKVREAKRIHQLILQKT